MVGYLARGWFTHTGAHRLRAEVIDGALDSAAALSQAGVQAPELDLLLLRVRTLTMLLTRHHHGHAAQEPLSGAQHAALQAHLQEATDGCLETQVFMLDCLDHVRTAADLRGLYLHTLHVTHVLRLLQLARRQSSVVELLASHGDELLHVAGSHAHPPLLRP